MKKQLLFISAMVVAGCDSDAGFNPCPNEAPSLVEKADRTGCEDNNGSPHGSWEFYWDNGELKVSANYHHGVKFGIWTYYYENGMKNREGHYSNDLKNGHWIYWHPNGMKKQEGQFINDRHNGYWVEWWPTGQVHSVGKMHNGFPVGAWTFRDMNGNKEVHCFDGLGSQVSCTPMDVE